MFNQSLISDFVFDFGFGFRLKPIEAGDLRTLSFEALKPGGLRRLDLSGSVNLRIVH